MKSKIPVVQPASTKKGGKMLIDNAISIKTRGSKLYLRSRVGGKDVVLATGYSEKHRKELEKKDLLELFKELLAKQSVPELLSFGFQQFDYLDGMKGDTRSAKYKADRRKNFKTAVDLLMQLKKTKRLLITEVSTADVEHMLQHLFRGKLSISSIKHIKGALSVVFDRATTFRDATKVEYNPCRLAQMPSKEKIRTLKRGAKQSDLEMLIRTALDIYGDQSIFPYVFILQGFLGLRPGELIGLKWEDVNIFNKHIILKRHIYEGNIITATKEKVERLVPLNASAMFALAKIRELNKEDDSSWILPSERAKGGHYHNHVPFAKAFKKVVEKLKEEGSLDNNAIFNRFYDLRATAANIVIENGGADIQQRLEMKAAEQLGHSSTKTTKQYYLGGDIFNKKIIEDTGVDFIQNLVQDQKRVDFVN